VKGSNDYTEVLEEALSNYRNYLETKLLPELQKNFRVYQSIFENLYNILLRKALIKENPYKYEEKITGIAVPRKGPFTDAEKQTEMSHRLSAFHSQIDFLNNYYTMTLDYIDLKEVKKLLGIVKYIDWINLSERSVNNTTGTLAEYLERIKKGNDSLASGIIKDTTQQLSKVTVEIISILKKFIVFHKENYKLEFRKRVIPSLQNEMQNITPEDESTLKCAKKIFIKEMSGYPYYPDLVKEILSEDYTEDHEKLKKAVLEKITAADENPKKKKKKDPPLKQILTDGLKILGASGINLSDAMVKLSSNSDALENRILTLGERFKLWILKAIRKKETGKIYEIEYFNAATGAGKKEKVNFELFKKTVAGKTVLFSKILSKTTPLYKRLEMASEEQLLDLLNKNITDLQKIHRRMESLHTYFLSEVSREQRQKLKGIKLELGAVKNSIIKANKKRYEYISLKEEREQLKKLGIEDID